MHEKTLMLSEQTMSLTLAASRMAAAADLGEEEPYPEWAQATYNYYVQFACFTDRLLNVFPPGALTSMLESVRSFKGAVEYSQPEMVEFFEVLDHLVESWDFFRAQATDLLEKIGFGDL
jgi:hypothetical protein